jgi:4-amino-4-deoxy-L-arabinose transferase-like glycosyltransferase
MPIDETRARRLIVLAAVGALVLRLAFGLGYWVGKPLTHDEHEYLSLARGLADGRGFVYDDAIEIGTAQHFGRGPGYPLFLALLDAGRPVPDSSPTRVKVAQALVGAGIVWLIGIIALRAGGPAAGAAAAAIAAAYPPLILIPAYVLSETVYCAAALSTVMVLQRAGDARPPGSSTGKPRRVDVAWAAAGGALAGLAALVRPTTLTFLPLVFIWFCWRKQPGAAVGMILAAFVVIAPWTVRNFRVYDRFVLIAAQGGVTFWTGNHPLARGEGDLAANPDLKRAELAFRNAHPGLTAEEMEPLYYRDALRWIAGHPFDWMVLLCRKAFYTVVPIGPSYTLHSVRYQLASSLPYLLVLPFGLLGLRRLWRDPGRPVVLSLLAASSVLVCLIFFPQERFRIPVIDPVLIVSAAALAGSATWRSSSSSAARSARR